ncbi:MAG: extracellular solute-binding protein [Saprospiraceae bacterium]|nr:extracellular solute-binding protein [Saprospiraceae bacterium]
MIRHTVFPVFMLLLGALLLATGCSNQRQDAGFKLLYWSSNNGGEIVFSRWAVDQWNSTHPEDQVRYQPIPEGQSSEEILLAAVVGGTTPDIYSNIWQGAVEFYRKSNQLIALDTLDGFLDFLHERCDSLTIAEITADDGHIYQFPWKINPLMTIYNYDLLQSMGLKNPPATYSAYMAAAEEFKKDKNGDGYIDQWFGNTSTKLAWHQRLFNFYPMYLAASDGLPLIKDGKAFFNNEHGVGVFRFLQTMYRQQYFSRQNDSAGEDLFVAEKYASKITGPWEIEYLEKFNKNKFNYVFYTIPVPDGHTGPVYTYCDPKNIVIFSSCKQPQLAFEFIKSMTTKEADLKFLQTTFQLPRRKNLDQDATFASFFQENIKMQAFAEQSKYIVGISNSEVMTEILDIISQEYEACVLYQMKTPEEAIADAEDAVNVLLRAER